MSPALKEFAVDCFNCPVFDGYGITEVGGISVDNKISRVCFMCGTEGGCYTTFR